MTKGRKFGGNRESKLAAGAENTPLFPEPETRFTLSLFRGDDDGLLEADAKSNAAAGDGSSDAAGGVDLNWTLREFLTHFIAPRAGFAPTYLRELHGTCGHWERATGNPPLREARDWVRTANERFNALALAQNTRRKHVIQLQVLLGWLGPDDGRRESAGCWDAAPRLRKLARERDWSIKHYTLDQLSAYLAACHAVPKPRKARVFSDSLGHQCLAVIAYNTALRINSILQLRHEWFEQDEFGWWAVMPNASMKKQQGRRFYFNRHAMRAVSLLGSHSGKAAARGRVLDWPILPGRVQDIRRDHILPAAGLPNQKRFGFHGMRQACVYQANRINSAAAKLILGHTMGDVTLEYYTDWQLYVETLDKLPQPAWAPLSGEQQLSLF